MRVTRHKRQILLFLSAILVPAGVLIGLSARLMYQDRELSLKRATDRRHAAVEQLRRELSARLEAIRLQEINLQRRSTHADPGQYSENPAVVFTAVLRGESLIMPWEASAPEHSAEFARRLQEGERLELAKKDYGAAAAAISRRAEHGALNTARSPAETADGLHLARAVPAMLRKPIANIRRCSPIPPAPRDAEGVGYRFYTAERLLDGGANVAAVQEFLGKEASAANRLTLPELYMIRTLLGRDVTVSSRIEEMQQSVALAKDIGRVKAQIEAGAEWVPYGQEPWLVTITSCQAGVPQLVVAVSSSKVATPGLTLRARVAEGDSLGDAFPGLPKLSGYDLCRRARNEGFHAPIVMLSAHSQEADRVMGLDLGANDYVSKPFSLRELLARVRALLRHEREHRQDDERLNHELEMAAKVQQDLFPRGFPKVPGLDYAGVCRPAQGVSGDYYDFLPLGDGQLGFLLADVSGKGISAALLRASLHAAVRTNVRSGEADCGRLLAKANRLLFETTAPERFATFFYGVYDAATRKLTYANAGHCPPMLVREQTRVRLESLTPPLGVLPALEEIELEVQLVPGDWLLVFSDGVTEAADEKGLEFGEEGLVLGLQRGRTRGAAGACEFIMDEVRKHLHEQRQPDDITLIAVNVVD